jgi:hypothetical protein
VHVFAVPALHAPFWHESFSVHALPSLHDVPLLACGLEQTPVVGSHDPIEWH